MPPQPAVTPELMICTRCAHLNGSHSLHCRTLQLPEGWTWSSDEEATQ